MRKKMPDELSALNTQHGDSDKPSQPSDAAKSPKPTLSLTVATQLLDLMQKVTAEEVNPKTVNAACNCATAIHKFILLNLKMAPKQ